MSNDPFYGPTRAPEVDPDPFGSRLRCWGIVAAPPAPRVGFALSVPLRVQHESTEPPLHGRS